MNKTVKALVSAGLAIGIIAGGSFSDYGILSPQQAEASSKPIVLKGGTDKLYTGTAVSSIKTSYQKKYSKFALYKGVISSQSVKKRDFWRVRFQVRANSKSAWKTVFYKVVPTNGKATFSSPYINSKYQFRFLLVNDTKKYVFYKIQYNLKAIKK